MNPPVTTAAPATAPAFPVHPIVYLDYRVRVFGHLVIMVTLGSIFYERGATLPLWTALVVQGLLWPHLAFISARNSRDSRRTERVNLLIDCFIAGCWVAQAAFSLWPTLAFLASLHVALISVAGVRFAVDGLAAMVGGSGVMGLLTGFHFQPESSPLTTGLSVGGILLYTAVFGMVTNRQARRIIQSNKTIEQQKQELTEALVALANQSKVVIDNARLFHEVQSQQSRLEQLSKDMERLYRLSTTMQEPLSLREQLHRVLEGASQMGLLDRIYIWAVSPEADRLVNLAGAGFAADEWKDFDGAEIPLTEAGAMSRAYEQGLPLLFNDQNPLPPELRLRPPYSEIRAIRTREFLVVPMIARGVTVGVLAGDNKPSGRPILAPTVDLLQTFASHAAVAVANARLFQAIEDKSRQLEAANRAKSQFLANMSHELRTPMNAILGYTELILDDAYGEVPEKIRGVLDRVDKSGRHLLGLINDVLDLSKIEAGQLSLSLSDYSMKDVVQSVFLAVEALAAEKQIELQFTLPPELPTGRGDERRLTQVLLNLVGNAIKFTEAGRLSVGVALDGHAFTVSVADTGPGIAPEDQQKIFEEFHQVDSSSTRKKGGPGLGLAIARRIIEMHGGRLWVESAPGAGSTFTFRVPVRVERRKRSVPVEVERRGAEP